MIGDMSGGGGFRGSICVSGTCYGIGVGPGDPELLTLKAARIIEACGVVAAPITREGATLALDIAAQAVDLSGKEIVRLPFAMSRDAGERAHRHAESVELLASRLSQGKDVAVLTLGDPGVFSSLYYLADDLRERSFNVEVVPRVTSFSAISARLGTGKLPELIEALAARGELRDASLVANCGLPGERVCRDLASFDPDEHAGYFTTVIVKRAKEAANDDK